MRNREREKIREREKQRERNTEKERESTFFLSVNIHCSAQASSSF